MAIVICPDCKARVIDNVCECANAQLRADRRARWEEEAGLIAADHAQLWSDADLEQAAMRASRMRGQLAAEQRIRDHEQSQRERTDER